MTVQHAQEMRRQLREALEGRPEVCFAYLHGSFVQGIPYHDLDVAVYLDPDYTVDTFDFEMGLSADLTLKLGFPVDIRVLNNAPLGFQHVVLQGEPLVVHDEALLADFIERVGHAYAEFAYLGRVYLREVTS